MQKRVLSSAIALALTALASGTALAQSSVTIYGNIDVSFDRVKRTEGEVINPALSSLNVKQSYSRVGPDLSSQSALGFKGVEDLGDGYKGNFVLEGQMGVDTGGLLRDGLLVADEYGQVAPGIVAAGDVAVVPTPLGLRRVPLWNSAIEQSKVAAAHLAGRGFGIYLPTVKQMTKSRKEVEVPMFRGYLSDMLGDVSTDFYGNPLCTAYQHDSAGAMVFDASGAPVVDTTIASQFNSMLPARIYTSESGKSLFKITVIDYNNIEAIATEKAKSCPPGAETCRGGGSSTGDIVAICCAVTRPRAIASFTSAGGIAASACYAIAARMRPVFAGSMSCLTVLPTQRIMDRARPTRNTAEPAYMMKFGSVGALAAVVAACRRRISTRVLESRGS